MKHLSMLVAFVFALGTQAQRSIEFRATVDPSVQSTPANGRLVVYLIDLDSDLSRAQPADGPFFSDPQPMFSVGVRGVPAGETIVVDDGAAFFPVMPSELSPGRYRAQAVLDQSRTNSSWRREEGNLFSEPVLFDVTEREQAQVVHLRLSQRVGSYESRSEEGVHPIAVQSRLLSTFRGHEVTLKATVIEPVDMEEGRRYPVVYEVPGFGGDHNRALWVGARMRFMPADSDIGRLARNAYWVVLDPEGPNGHHLFADSANNGPVSQALTRELIPAIDEAFQTIDSPSARLLRGHSSGGWSVIWLMLNWPDVFGGAWSSSPDPVDFSSFQAVDIYTEANMYRREDKSRDKANEIVWIPSYKDEHGNVGMTIRQENRMEEVLGPGNTSGQQWDSWLAVFGPKRADGSPADLFDPRTGAIDRGVARQYEKYDIVRTLRSKRASYGPILKDRLRLIVGDMDNYDLDEAVKKLKAELDGLSFAGNRAYHGYITIVPGRDHSNIFETPEMEAIPGQMLEELERRGHIEKAATGEGE